MSPNPDELAREHVDAQPVQYGWDSRAESDGASSAGGLLHAPSVGKSARLELRIREADHGVSSQRGFGD